MDNRAALQRVAGQQLPPERAQLVGHPSVAKDMRAFQFEFLLSRGLKRSDMLLDLGCGVLRGGVPLISFLDASRYWGFDVSSARLAEAHRELTASGLAQKHPVLTNEYGQMPLFDVIWCFQVMIHLNDAIAAATMREAARHLRDCGRFFLSVFLDSATHGPGGSGTWFEFPVVRRPLNFYERLATNNGLQITEVLALTAPRVPPDAKAAMLLLKPLEKYSHQCAP